MLVNNVFSFYGNAFSSLFHFALSPFPRTFITFPTAFFIVPAMAVSFFPVLAFAAIVGCLSCLSNNAYAGPNPRVPYAQPYDDGGSYGRAAQQMPPGPYQGAHAVPPTVYTDRQQPGAPYTAPTQASPRVAVQPATHAGHDYGPSAPMTAPAAHGPGQHVRIG